MRYKIVYSKAGTAQTTWKHDMESAIKLADDLRAAGYTVTMAEHSKNGSRTVRHNELYFVEIFRADNGVKLWGNVIAARTEHKAIKKGIREAGLCGKPMSMFQFSTDLILPLSTEAML